MSLTQRSDRISSRNHRAPRNGNSERRESNPDPLRDRILSEPGRSLDLAQEAIRAEHRSEFGVEHLERDEPLVPEVASEVHGRHAAAPEFALEHVAVGQSSFEMIYSAGQFEVLAGATRLA